MPDNRIHPSFPTADSNDEYPQVTQADLDQAKFRVGFEPASRKPQAITSWGDHVMDIACEEQRGRHERCNGTV